MFWVGDPSRVLTFDGVEVEWLSDGSAPWLMLSLSGTLNVTNGANLTFKFDSKTTKTRNAIYMNEGAVLNVTNASTFQILGVGTEGTAGQGIQLDKAGKSTINVIDGSTFLIDGTNRGYVNSPVINVEDSLQSKIVPPMHRMAVTLQQLIPRLPIRITKGTVFLLEM